MSETATASLQSQETQVPAENVAEHTKEIGMTAEAVQNREISTESKTLLGNSGGLSIQNPENYVLEFSEQTLVDQELVKDFKDFAAQNNMSLESAKQVAKFYESHMQKQQSQQTQKFNATQTALEQQCLNDAEFGGARLHDNLRYAKAALTRFDSGELGKILESSGFGSHPEVIRFMYRVGKALAEKSMVSGSSPKREPTAAELFYPSMRKS